KFQVIPVLGMPSGFSFNRYYCSWFEPVFRPAPFVSEFSFIEFSGLHCCSFVKVLLAAFSDLSPAAKYTISPPPHNVNTNFKKFVDFFYTV
ncbi:MAG: hypothetical protein K2N15_11895, partial [Lachnospiraceae bacterium]|nr:hypothetical protein [Lachnospiraceae bacterium]